MEFDTNLYLNFFWEAQSKKPPCIRHFDTWSVKPDLSNLIKPTAVIIRLLDTCSIIHLKPYMSNILSYLDSGIVEP